MKHRNIFTVNGPTDCDFLKCSIPRKHGILKCGQGSGLVCCGEQSLCGQATLLVRGHNEMLTLPSGRYASLPAAARKNLDLNILDLVKNMQILAKHGIFYYYGK